MARPIATSVAAASNRNKAMLMLAIVLGIASFALMFAFLNSRGGGDSEVERALCLGAVLFALSLLVNVTLTVVQRRVPGGPAPVRCASGMRAVGGGGEIHSGGYMLRDSAPLVEQRVPVGWSVRPKAVQRFAYKTVDGGQLETALAAAHRHKYGRPPLYQPLEGAGSPAEVTVYAICARLPELSAGRKRTPGKGTTRSGG